MFTLYIHVDTLTVTEKVKMLSYRRDRAVGCISFGQKWKTGTRRQYFTDNKLRTL